MSSQAHSHEPHDKSSNARQALEPLITDPLPSAATSRMELVQNAIMAPFGHRKRDSTKILAELAPVIMTPRMIGSASSLSSRQSRAAVSDPRLSGSRMDFVTLGRAPVRLGMSRRITSRDLQIVEATDELLQSEVPEPDGVASTVSLWRGFNATIPSAELGKARRRQTRSVEAPHLGLKRLGMSVRGIMTDEEDHDGRSVASEDDVVIVNDQNHRKAKRKGRESLSAAKLLGKDELTRQKNEILRDKENIHVKRNLINSEIAEISHKIMALDNIRSQLEQDLLKLQEDELELDDELQGIGERLQFEKTVSQSSSSSSTAKYPPTSRRRRGPAFLPSEHDELPPGVAFMTLESHLTPITALDFSEPYGTLVSTSREDTQPRVWDLFSGTEIGRLRGHSGPVKCVQVEGQLCLTGAEDGTVRIWDLRHVGDEDGSEEEEGEVVNLSDIAEEDTENDGPRHEAPQRAAHSPCTRVLEGHTQAVTALYFEDDCLVTGASDKTLRQWDLNTGQCVMTMDILWAISHNGGPGSSASSNPFASAAASVGAFAVPTPPFADGSRDMYEDFVGGVQFWGYGLVSGSGDGAVRMWDMRTGQSHRTLLGHTAPVTCLQFDELHIVSGSLDKTIRIWDLRSGAVFETLKFDHGVTGLQFDSRKIIAATGVNDLKVYNRTSLQQTTLMTNGHTRPAEHLRYMDRYLVSGGRDAMLKVWSI